MARRFLSARWQKLVMANYEVPTELLQKHLPNGVELDLWQGKCLVSMVGFQFRNTRLLGLPIPWHINFPEVNLRYYVVRKMPDGTVRRGVVFVREIVPKFAIAFVARTIYNEPYLACPMDESVSDTHAEYRWKTQGKWNTLRAEFNGEPVPQLPGSESEFITEHYWGYCGQRNGTTLEYEVKHPSWRIWNATEYKFDCDIAANYGNEFTPYLQAQPTSVFIAEGSSVEVWQGETVR
jgi:uncharacterized protein